MAVFKVGDRVKALSSYGIMNCAGKAGVIVYLISVSGQYVISFNDATLNNSNFKKSKLGCYTYNCIFEDHMLEYSRIRDTKIARKLNKNNIEKVEDGWIYLR